MEQWQCTKGKNLAQTLRTKIWSGLLIPLKPGLWNCFISCTDTSREGALGSLSTSEFAVLSGS